MNGLRKLCLCLAALAAFTLPAAMPKAAEANPTHVRTVSYRAYYVYYRSCPHDSWHMYGYTTNYNAAAYYASAIRAYGYESFVR